jgi:hypothetical protein
VTLDKLSAAILVKIDPSFEKYMDVKDEITVKLDKALYGCVQSARLWFEMLIAELKLNGYAQNTVDPCVLNKSENNQQSTVLLHVDDIKVLSQIAGECKRLHAALEAKFGKVTLHEGNKHNYLGMTFEYSNGEVHISMSGYEQSLVKDWNDINMHLLTNRIATAATPAANTIFEKGDSELLDSTNTGIFHSYVMRLAYLAKRVKPELSVAISYLSTQVTKPNIDDLKKLDRSVFHIEDFLSAQGYKCVSVIGQDNQSTIAMITEKTKESMRTRHIKVRYFWLRERIKRKEINLLYVATGKMLADMLTKPMQGNMFRSFLNNFCCRNNVIVKRDVVPKLKVNIKGVR